MFSKQVEVRLGCRRREARRCNKISGEFSALGAWQEAPTSIETLQTLQQQSPHKNTAQLPTPTSNLPPPQKTEA